MLALFALLFSASTTIADIRSLLREQGFAGPINGRETIIYVGKISEGRNDYQIYLYRGVFRAAVVDHGVNRLIVVRDKALIGAYDTGMLTKCRVRSERVLCDNGTVKFGRRGP